MKLLSGIRLYPPQAVSVSAHEMFLKFVSNFFLLFKGMRSNRPHFCHVALLSTTIFTDLLVLIGYQRNSGERTVLYSVCVPARARVCVCVCVTMKRKYQTYGKHDKRYRRHFK